MRYGILGDIHGNLGALEAVLGRLAAESVDCLLSVGDVVGYGAAPTECIALLREAGARVVMGNHDAAAIDRLDTTCFNQYARAAVAWTKEQLSDEDVAWMSTLPLTLQLDHCVVAHGTLHRPELFDYIQNTTDADASLDMLTLPVCFVGHTHVPVALLRLRDDPLRTAYTIDPEIDIAETTRALVNVGSIGQPRDEDSRAAYAVYDSDAQRVWIRRVEYDIDVEAKRIRSAGLPPMLADRLYLGV
jgi:diadenosine tetraphosphatase ApaH/serine/threonine PP2A family protein phosphatase